MRKRVRRSPMARPERCAMGATIQSCAHSWRASGPNSSTPGRARMATVRPTAVGGFVLGGLALAVAVLLLFGRSRLFEPTTRAVIFFGGSVAGLDIGAPVTFRGVPVGSVQRMAIHLSSAGQ